MVQELVDARVDHARRSVPRPAAESHDAASALDRVLEAVVDDDVVELVLRRELLLGDAQARARPASASSVPRPTSRARSASRDGGAMKTCTASGIALADLPRALDLDLEHDGHAGGRAALELGAQRPVAAAGVLGPLDEVARVDALRRTPRRRGSGSRRRRVSPGRGGARRGRDAELELGHALAQQPDQRALADARRAR